MKTLFCTAFLAAIGVSAATASNVLITFDQPAQKGIAGQTLQFFGTITNLDTSAVFLNGDSLSFNIAAPDLAINDLFFANVPISLAPAGQAGDSSGLLELFDVTLSLPLSSPLGTYPGTYNLSGGSDGNAADLLGSATFSVTTVPEPSSVHLVSAAALMVLVLRKRWNTRTS